MNNITQLEENREKWLQAIKVGNSKALELMYRTYRTGFVNWLCQNMGCDAENARDIFQESVVALYKNAKAGRLDNMKSSIKTYLFGIGKKRYLYHQRQTKIKTDELGAAELKLETPAPPIENILNERQLLVSSLLGEMRLGCREILTLFYYRGYKSKEIAQKLNYKSDRVVRSLKVRCMEILRKLVYQKMRN